jgi:hypothetical protein
VNHILLYQIDSNNTGITMKAKTSGADICLSADSDFFQFEVGLPQGTRHANEHALGFFNNQVLGFFPKLQSILMLDELGSIDSTDARKFRQQRLPAMAVECQNGGLIVTQT